MPLHLMFVGEADRLYKGGKVREALCSLLNALNCRDYPADERENTVTIIRHMAEEAGII